jgi:zinc protease
MGYVEDIQAMPQMYDYSLSFFNRYYRPENCVVLVIGDFDRQQTLDWIRQYYGDWKPGYEPPKVKAEPQQKQEKRIDVPYDGQSLPIVWLAYKSDAFDPDNRSYVASSVLCELAFGETSAIHKKLVLDEQVVEWISAEVNFNRDPGLLDIVTRVKDPNKVDYVISEIDHAIAQYQKLLPDAQRLADLKSRLRYDFLMGLDTPMNVARGVVRFVAVTGGIEAVDALYKSYEQVTGDDVRKAANVYLVPQRRTVAILRGGQS